MATGIIIRAVAPHLQSKLKDPAVVAVDANGKFVVSLLSGHFGGANELTKVIAEGINAIPVITTASDSMGKQSVEEIAKKYHLSILNPLSLVAVNAALVNGERMALILVGDIKFPIDEVAGYTIERALSLEQASEIASTYGAAAIVMVEFPSVAKFTKPVTFLKPKRITMGIGARKEATETQITDAMEKALTKANLPRERIDGLATVDIKRDSAEMNAAAEKFGFKFEYLSVPELAELKHEDLSPDSAMVQEKIGVGGVSERAALLKAGKNPHLILKKQIFNGVTVAIAEGE
jgi:cobalt-precorrin 5A hydrolase